VPPFNAHTIQDFSGNAIRQVVVEGAAHGRRVARHGNPALGRRYRVAMLMSKVHC